MQTKQFDVEFTKDGKVFEPAQVDAVLGGAADITDLFVLSHGWNNDTAEARGLYDALGASLARVLRLDLIPGLAGRSFGELRVFWPSKRFADEDLIPGGGAASAAAPNDHALLRLLESLKHDPERLDERQTDPVRSACVEAAKAVLTDIETNPAARREFVLQLRALLDPSAAEADDGSLDFFVRDPEELFVQLREPVAAPSGTRGGGATAVDAGGAAGLQDMLGGFRAAARRIANFTTYYEMKARAGKVGATGAAQLLRSLRGRHPALKIHLVGHSFGGRLVTAAAHALPDKTQAVTMTLLQAAYSHNGLAQKYDDKNDGAFRAVLSQARASGPIVVTHTKNDRAVGIAYPLASRIAREPAAAIGDENDPYGGMGRNGAQRTPEADGLAEAMHRVGQGYGFATGKVYNLNADEFIADHSAVTGPEVAYAILSAVAAV